MVKINSEVEKIEQVLKKDNFMSLPLSAQERILSEICIVINYIHTFKDDMTEISYNSLIKKLKEKKWQLEGIYHARTQNPLYKY